MVEYYPDESPSDPGPSGAGVEWSLVGWIKGNGPCGKFFKWIFESFLIVIHSKKGIGPCGKFAKWISE